MSVVRRTASRSRLRERICICVPLWKLEALLAAPWLSGFRGVVGALLKGRASEVGRSGELDGGGDGEAESMSTSMTSLGPLP